MKNGVICGTGKSIKFIRAHGGRYAQLLAQTYPQGNARKIL